MILRSVNLFLRLCLLVAVFHVIVAGNYANAADLASTSSTLPLKIMVGMHILDIAKLDMKECDFFADFYIWYKISAEQASDWSPANVEFMNGSIESATKLSSEETASGDIYWIQRVKGRFRGVFNLHSYPFDSQYLPIVIEDSDLNSRELIFVADPVSSPDALKWVENNLQIPDWKLSGAGIETLTHEYATKFGMADKAEASYSRFVFTLKISRLFVPHLIKFVIPLIVIAGMAYTVFFINAQEFESQCGICVTSLLSAVALHISQADALPSIGYLVISDKIFILFYIVIFTALLQTVVANNYAKRGRVQVAEFLDNLFRIVYPLSLIAGSAFFWWFL